MTEYECISYQYVCVCVCVYVVNGIKGKREGWNNVEGIEELEKLWGLIWLMIGRDTRGGWCRLCVSGG